MGRIYTLLRGGQCAISTNKESMLFGTKHPNRVPNSGLVGVDPTNERTRSLPLK